MVVLKESVGGDQKEGLNSSLNGKTENPTNGTVQPGSEETSPQMVTVELSDKGGETEKVTELNVSTTSFLSSLSTPRWSQFRRVFNFNRSVPTSMDQVRHILFSVRSYINLPVNLLKLLEKSPGQKFVQKSRSLPIRLDLGLLHSSLNRTYSIT